MTETPYIDLFHGRITPHAAQVYARVRGLPGGSEWALRGQIRGPESRARQTLRAIHSLRDLGAGECVLAGGTIVDPCDWSPESPNWYRVVVELCHRGQPVVEIDRAFALRTLGVRGTSFFFQGRRWVLRGVQARTWSTSVLSDCRESGTTLVVTDPGDDLLRAAGWEGVPVCVLVTGTATPSELRRVARRLAEWPCVALVGISVHDRGEWLEECPNIVPIRCLENAAEVQLAGCEPALLDVDTCSAQVVGERAGKCLTLARRTVATSESLLAAREDCDQLQAELAPYGECAGFIVAGSVT